MSTIETGIIGPDNGKKKAPDLIPPLHDPAGGHAGSDDTRNPEKEDVPPIHPEPEPEKGRRDAAGIRRP